METLQQTQSKAKATGRMSPFRLGMLSYVNVLPVYHHFESTWNAANPEPFPIELVSGTPSTLNAQLGEGDLTVSPISSVELLRHADRYLILDDLSIHSVGAVKSVMLFSHYPIRKLDKRRIGLTTASATSRVLLDVLLHEAAGVEPYFRDLDSDGGDPLKDHDAALLIGDAALQYVPDGGVYRYDLAELWHESTGTPMVFAVWAARKDTGAEDLTRARKVAGVLHRSLERSRSNMLPVVREGARRLHLSEAETAAYFRHLRYDLDGMALKGLRLFLNFAARRGIGTPAEIEFLRRHA